MRRENERRLKIIAGILPIGALIAAAGLCRPDDAKSETVTLKTNQLDQFGYPANLTNAYEAGRAAASRDLTNGVLVMKTYGLPMPSSGEYADLLEERCHMQIQAIAGCIVSSGEVAWARGYNEISGSFIRAKYGTNILERIAEEEKKRFQAKMAGHRPRNRASDGQAYSVKAGDTLVRIAKQHDITVKQLMDANPGIDPLRLEINRKLHIPAPEGK